MGYCMPVFEVLSQITRLAKQSREAVTTQNDVQGVKGNKDRTALLRNVAAGFALLKARLDSILPRRAFTSATAASSSSYHVALFRVFVLTGHLYLRQSVLRSNSTAIESQLLVSQLIEASRFIVGTPAESALLFPLFVAGVDAATAEDRVGVSELLDGLWVSCGIKNIRTARALMEEVWERNECGERYVDWAVLARDRGWCVSFA
jgi:hypothetical protein